MCEVFVINPAATKISCEDAIDEKLSQLQAIAYNTWGEGFKSFEGLQDPLKNSYLWAISGLIDDLVSLRKAVRDREALERQASREGCGGHGRAKRAEAPHVQ